MTPHTRIACGAAKLTHAAKARDLYTGSLFRLARAFAERSGDWWILSAKHGRVHPDTVLEPYDMTLTGPGRRDYARVWATLVAGQIRDRIPSTVPLVVTAPAAYTGWITRVENSVSLPLKGVPLGLQCRFFSRNAP